MTDLLDVAVGDWFVYNGPFRTVARVLGPSPGSDLPWTLYWIYLRMPAGKIYSTCLDRAGLEANLRDAQQLPKETSLIYALAYPELGGLS